MILHQTVTVVCTAASHVVVQYQDEKSDGNVFWTSSDILCRVWHAYVEAVAP